MSFFDDGEILTEAPEQTAWFKCPIRVRGCAEPLELECRWRMNARAVQASTEAAFRELPDREAAELELVARHVVVGWRNVPARDGGDEPYKPEGCVELLRKMRYLVVPGAESKVAWLPFVEFIGDAKNFGAPLVDPEALGKP